MEFDPHIINGECVTQALGTKQINFKAIELKKNETCRKIVHIMRRSLNLSQRKLIVRFISTELTERTRSRIRIGNPT